MSDFTLAGTLGISSADCDRLLSLKNGQAALVYLYILRHQGSRPRGGDVVSLGLTEASLAAAVRLLESAGLIAARPMSAAAPDASDERPVYRAEEIARGVKNDVAFAHVVREFERLLGKLLSSSDLQTLYAMYDWRGLPAGVLLLLGHFCVEDSRRRFGENGRPPTMRQIDREASLWEKAGVRTEQAAEQHIRRLETLRTDEHRIFSSLGLSGRAPTPSEQKYIEEWLAEGFTPEAILLAFDKTALATGKLSWKYCAAILQRWKEQNCLTAEDAEAKAARPRRESVPGVARASLSEPGEQELDSVARVKAILQNRKEA